MELRNELCSIALRWETSSKENLIELLVFLADLNYTLDNCGLCKGEAIRVFAYLLCDGAKKVYVG